MSDTQQVPQRSEMAIEYTWDLTPVYANDQAWEADLALSLIHI